MSISVYISGLAEIQILLLPAEHQQLIYHKIAFMRHGHFSDRRSLGDKLLELRIHTGPGYRIYYTHHLQGVVVLLVGAKHNQRKDIKKARFFLESLGG
jgi:putative addiction module killer protein